MVDVAKTSFFTPIANFFTKLIGIGKSVMGFVMKIPILGNFLGGFARGFGSIMRGVPVIGWFISGIMGIIDFFTAFNSTQGTMYEKIKAGITGMLTGFFDPVFGLLGWLTDKFLGLFGIEVEGGVGSKLKEGFKSLLGGFFGMIDWIAGFFTETIPNLFTNAKNSLVDAWNKYTDVDFIKSIVEKLTDFAKMISDFVKDLIPDFGSIRDGIFEKAKEYLPD